MAARSSVPAHYCAKRNGLLSCLGLGGAKHVQSTLRGLRSIPTNAPVERGGRGREKKINNPQAYVTLRFSLRLC